MRTERFTTKERTISNRAKAGLGAIGIATGAFLSTACGGSEGAPAPNEGRTITAAENDIQVASKNSDVIFGEDCKNQDDIYNVGRFMSSTGQGYEAFEDVDTMLARMKFFDGEANSSSQTPIELTSDQEQDIWSSYQSAVAGVDASTYNLKDGKIVAFGDATPDDGPYDGKLDDGLKLCVTIDSVHGITTATS